MTAPLLVSAKQQIDHGAAALNRHAMSQQRVFSVCLFGGSCEGKTSLLELTLQRLGDQVRCGVIIGNLRAEEDSARIAEFCRHVVAVETVDLTPELTREALMHFDLTTTDLLFIERAAEAPPHPWDLGQSATVGMFSVDTGNDRVCRHPQRLERAELLILSKIDLLPGLPFDPKRFHSCVRQINPLLPILEISTMTGQGMDPWCQWLIGRLRQCRAGDAEARIDESDYYLG